MPTKDTRTSIQKIISEITRLNTIRKHHNQTKENLDAAYSELNVLEDQLVKELQDIEKLEGMSIQSLFYNVLGNKEDQLEKERQEYLMVSLKHKELKKSIELLDYEHTLLEGKVQEISGLESDLEKLKEKRLQEIMSTDTTLRTRIKGLYHQADQLEMLKAELHEAGAAGAECLKAVGMVLKHLKDAEHWGDWDMMNKGGYYSQRKHNSMDRAMEAANNTKHFLRRYDKELIDVNIERTNLEVNIEGFSRFMDIFFDNMLSDWVIQRKIKNARQGVEAVYDKIQRYQGIIDKELEVIDAQIDELVRTKDKILEA